MELHEFVSQTLSEILTGIRAAQHNSGNGAKIAPKNSAAGAIKVHELAMGLRPALTSAE